MKIDERIERLEHVTAAPSRKRARIMRKTAVCGGNSGMSLLPSGKPRAADSRK
jgi:hypothetical protein